MPPKFSIIIPVYNVAPYLRECLDSVLAQTFTDWEAICVDDGSTDGSGAILDEYAAKDSRLRVIHQRNAGVSVARNAALDLAKGDWILFVDADDWLETRTLERFEALSDKADINFFCPRMHLPSGEIVLLTKRVAPKTKLNAETSIGLYRQAFEDGKDAFGWPWNKFIRADCARNIYFDTRLKMFEDELFVLKVCNAARSYQILDWPLYNYRIRAAGATNGSLHDWASIAEIFEQEAASFRFRYLSAIANHRARVLRRLADPDRMRFSHLTLDFIGASKLNMPYVAWTYRKEIVLLYLKRGFAMSRFITKIYRWLRRRGEFAHV